MLYLTANFTLSNFDISIKHDYVLQTQLSELPIVFTFNKNTNVEHPGDNNFPFSYGISTEQSLAIGYWFKGLVTSLLGLTGTILKLGILK